MDRMSHVLGGIRLGLRRRGTYPTPTNLRRVRRPNPLLRSPNLIPLKTLITP